MTKKVLALALALTMLLGLCVTGTAWDPTPQDVTTLKDWDTVTDKDAALILNAFSIMEGDERGFRPFDNVRRSEAAKMIAVALMRGVDISVLFAAGNAGEYNDVIPGYWYMGYVNFLTSFKVMVGSNGNFRPDDTVSGYELLKMCLVCLNYNPETEGLTGDGWDENTMALATGEGQQDLTQGTTVTDWSAPLTRMNSATIIKNMIYRSVISYTEEGDIEYGLIFGEDVLDEDFHDAVAEILGTTP